jgi:hypothetical protein
MQARRHVPAQRIMEREEHVGIGFLEFVHEEIKGSKIVVAGGKLLRLCGQLGEIAWRSIREQVRSIGVRPVLLARRLLNEEPLAHVPLWACPLGRLLLFEVRLGVDSRV